LIKERGGHWKKGKKQTPEAALKSKMNAVACSVIWIEQNKEFRSTKDGVDAVGEFFGKKLNANLSCIIKRGGSLYGQHFIYADKERQSKIDQANAEKRKQYEEYLLHNRDEFGRWRKKEKL
jgi:hypothetical protein